VQGNKSAIDDNYRPDVMVLPGTPGAKSQNRPQTGHALGLWRLV